MKKPDLVAWTDEQGYHSKSLTYGTNISAPAIKLEDVDSWKQSAVTKVNHQFKTKYEELIEEARKLIDEYNWNETVYNSEYAFLPIIGHIYHLYIRENESLFLSLVGPQEWKQKYITSFKLDSSEKWIKI